MNKLGAFEIGFYNGDQAMVGFEQYDREFPTDDLGLLAFTLFSLRQWRNMGKRNIMASASACLLESLHVVGLPKVLDLVRYLPRADDPSLADTLKTVREALEKTSSSLVVAALLDMRRRSHDGLCDELYGGEGKRPVFEVVPDRGRARRRFIGTAEQRGDVFTLHSVAKGFGLLGVGLGYYAPASIFVLLHHLASRRPDDKDYRDRLVDVAERCASAWLTGQVTIVNQSLIATEIVSTVQGWSARQIAS